jgi:hypothetical protein
MKLLRLSSRVTSTSASYSQFSFGFKEIIDQRLCSLLEYDVLIDKNIKVFHGDGSILKNVEDLQLIQKLFKEAL